MASACRWIKFTVPTTWNRREGKAAECWHVTLSIENAENRQTTVTSKMVTELGHLRMQMLTGKVRNIRHSTETSGSKEGGTSTSHVALFELEGVPVTLSLPEVIVISEGDEVCVAGNEKRGLFRGLAYSNKTNRVKGKSSVGIYILAGAVFCGSVLLAPVGLWLLYCGYRNQKAYGAIDLPLTVARQEPTG